MPALPTLKQLSAEEPESPFSHMRFNTKSHGKLLVFATGNVIRAGKYTHTDAVSCLLAFVRWAREQSPELCLFWPAAISMPNSVLTGQFSTPVSKLLGEHNAATSSNRFPGISIRLPDTMISKITPEVFLKDSKWILPGVRCAKGAFDAIAHLIAVVDSVPSSKDP